MDVEFDDFAMLTDVERYDFIFVQERAASVERLKGVEFL